MFFSRLSSFVSRLFYQLVGRGVRENHTRLKGFCLFEIHRSVGDDDNNIPHIRLVCCCSIQANYATARLARNSVGFETLSIGNIYHLNLLATNQVQVENVTNGEQ